MDFVYCRFLTPFDFFRPEQLPLDDKDTSEAVDMTTKPKRFSAFTTNNPKLLRDKIHVREGISQNEISSSRVEAANLLLDHWVRRKTEFWSNYRL